MIGLGQTYFKDDIDKMRIIEQRLLSRKVKAWKWKNSNKRGRK